MRYIQQQVFKYYTEYLYTELNILYEIKMNRFNFLTLFKQILQILFNLERYTASKLIAVRHLSQKLCIIK